LGTVYGEQDLARWASKNSLADAIDRTELLSMWASFLVKEGKLKDAADKLAQAPRRDVLPFVYARTELLEGQKQFAQAESWLVEVIKHYPNLFEPRLKAACLYWQTNAFSKATKILGTRPGGYSRDEWNLLICDALIDLGRRSPGGLKQALQSINALGVAPAEFLQVIIGRLAQSGYGNLALSISEWRDGSTPSIQTYQLLQSLKKSNAAKSCFNELLAGKYPVNTAEQAFRQKAFDVLSQIQATGNKSDTTDNKSETADSKNVTTGSKSEATGKSKATGSSSEATYSKSGDLGGAECRIQLLKAAANAADTSAEKVITTSSNPVRSCSPANTELINALHGRPHKDLTKEIFERNEAGRISFYLAAPAKISLEQRLNSLKMALQLCVDDHVIERRWAQEDLITIISNKEPLLWQRVQSSLQN
jgi:tetratricopeptide (TPR) repeat protein